MKRFQPGALFAHQPFSRAQITWNSWLEASDFQFDPFDRLDASSDPHLGDYLVDHEAFAIVWQNHPALIFAPVGGGKTAMRICATRACYAGVGDYHPFPLPYLLSDYDIDRQPRTANDHLRGIVEAGARALFISLAWRPNRFLNLADYDQLVVVKLLERTLRGSLPHYLAILRDAPIPYALADVIDSSYRILRPSSTEELQRFCVIMQSFQSSSMVSADNSEAEFEQLVSVLTSRLGFSSIFLLVDGIDAFPETSSDAEIAVDSVRWLVSQAAMWTKQNIYLKGFLPLELERTLVRRLPGTFPLVRRVHLRWTDQKLLQLLQQRIAVATDQKFNSLDAISSNLLTGIESILVQTVKPLPREALVLAQRVLKESASRLRGEVGKLSSEDIDAAVEWYQDQQARFGAFIHVKEF